MVSVIALAVFGSVLSGALFVIRLFGCGLPKLVHVFLVAWLFCVHCVITGFLSSVRSGFDNPIALTFAWGSVVLAFIALLIVGEGGLGCGDGVTSNVGATDADDETVPEERHMHACGQVKNNEETVPTNPVGGKDADEGTQARSVVPGTQSRAVDVARVPSFVVALPAAGRPSA